MLQILRPVMYVCLAQVQRIIWIYESTRLTILTWVRLNKILKIGVESTMDFGEWSGVERRSFVMIYILHGTVPIFTQKTNRITYGNQIS